MKADEIKPGIYWVGAKDWYIRDFHGYKTERGTTYNAFLIVDEKIVLVDTVKPTHTDEMLERISSVIDPRKIDIIVSNHVEMDHSGGLPEIMKLCPYAQLITSPNGEKGLKEHYDTTGWNFKVVRTSESINIGRRSLNFVLTPMVHWPDSMITYIPEEKILLPNDAFGQHIANDTNFDDTSALDIVIEEAAKYYANIVYPYGLQAKRAVEGIKDFDIEIIAPSHGVIWRKNVDLIVKKYKQWATGFYQRKALIVYDSMWQSTEMMADMLQFELEANNIPVMVKNLKHNHISDVMKYVLESRFVFLGTPTLNSNVLPTMASFLTYLKGLKPSNKIGLAFGSYGWMPDVLDEVDGVMQSLGWHIPVSKIASKYRPNDDIKKRLKEAVGQIVNYD